MTSLSAVLRENMWIAPFAALVAGILTSLTPCALSSVPLVIGYVGGASNKDPRRSFRLAFTFALGMAVTVTVMGTLAAVLGKLMQNSGSWWFIVMGILMIMMALQTWELFDFIPSTALLGKNKKRGYIGAFIAGILGGLFSSPCATPVLIALLTLVAGSGNIAWGIFLLLLYSIGHSILVLIAGTSIGFVKSLTASKKYGTFSILAKYGTGFILLLFGLYLLFTGF
jgi:cytochrome c biogenesis protein CcdA